MDKQLKTKNIKIPNNTEFLKKHFSHCFDKNSNFDFDKFKTELSQNEDLDFSKESYGMDWLGKSYARLLASDEATTLLKEDEKFNQKEENKNSENLLIKGDNLEILKHLSNAYYEKVKMIYIDPPYNTGSDGFVYQDDRKFTTEELSKLAGIDKDKAKRILDFTQSKSNSHSAWLTFMYPRLYIAKQLLKDDGVIFISIDDNEVAQLRILMDEIFGEENFVGEFIWHKKLTGGYDNDNINTKHEKIFIYVKSKESFNMNYVKAESNYTLMDNDGKKYKWDSLWNVGGLTYSKSLDYPIKAPDGSDIYPHGERGVAFWLWSKTKVEKDKDLLNFKKDKNGQWKIYKKIYASDSLVPSSLLDKDIVGGNTTSSREMKNIFGVKPFDYAKPSSLIKFLVERGSNNSDIIFDFFAGSGTTADAVMQLNAEDGGNRKFMLAQLPEKIDKNKDKTAYDFVKDELKIENPTIFEITKERIIRSAKKIIKDNEESKNKKDLSKQDFGFKIFETIPNNEGVWEDYNFEAEEFDSQTKLFNETKLNDEDLNNLLITWKTNDNISLTQNLKEIDLDGYNGYYFDTKLYLVNTGFKTKNLKKLLEEIDSNKDFNPATIIAFGYNFESKNLREIGENIKNYVNKKHIDVDFITRY
ncbi:site-specific DNA-methyltransferase [Candidatus Woesearchaeota archaeon]|nr:site-specific DNA-methyltransferase [archaeon]MBT7237495.1 site-specific DNA-methyltransferase [Candidatus Woesearchaeota archaeon]